MTTFNPGYDLLDRAARQQRIDNVALAQRINTLATELKRRVTAAEFETWRSLAADAIRTGELGELAANLNARLEELDNAGETPQLENLKSAMEAVDKITNDELPRSYLFAAMKCEDQAREEYLNCLQEE